MVQRRYKVDFQNPILYQRITEVVQRYTSFQAVSKSSSNILRFVTEILLSKSPKDYALDVKRRKKWKLIVKVHKAILTKFHRFITLIFIIYKQNKNFQNIRWYKIEPGGTKLKPTCTTFCTTFSYYSRHVPVSLIIDFVCILLFISAPDFLNSPNYFRSCPLGRNHGNTFSVLQKPVI